MSEDLTYPGTPIPVEIKNWAEPIKPPFVKKTTVKTYIIDGSGAVGQKVAQISDYEPKRYRMVISVVDTAVALTLEAPTASPDPGNTASAAPQGLYLSPSTTPYTFNGPDAMWLNSIQGAAVTRITVTKEYC